MDSEINYQKFKEKHAPSLIGSTVRNESPAGDSDDESGEDKEKKDIKSDKGSEDKEKMNKSKSSENDNFDDLLRQSEQLQASALELKKKMKAQTKQMRKTLKKSEPVPSSASEHLREDDMSRVAPAASFPDTAFKHTPHTVSSSEDEEVDETKKEPKYYKPHEKPTPMEIVEEVNDGNYVKDDESTEVAVAGSSKDEDEEDDEDDEKLNEKIAAKLHLDSIDEESAVPDSTIENDSTYIPPAAMSEGSSSRLLVTQHARSRSLDKPKSKAQQDRPHLARGESCHGGTSNDDYYKKGFPLDELPEKANLNNTERKPRGESRKISSALKGSSLQYLRSLSSSRSRADNDRKVMGIGAVEEGELKSTGGLINAENFTQISDLEEAMDSVLKEVSETTEDSEAVENLKKPIVDASLKIDQGESVKPLNIETKSGTGEDGDANSRNLKEKPVSTDIKHKDLQSEGETGVVKELPNSESIKTDDKAEKNSEEKKLNESDSTKEVPQKSLAKISTETPEQKPEKGLETPEQKSDNASEPQLGATKSDEKNSDEKNSDEKNSDEKNSDEKNFDVKKSDTDQYDESQSTVEESSVQEKSEKKLNPNNKINADVKDVETEESGGVKSSEIDKSITKGVASEKKESEKIAKQAKHEENAHEVDTASNKMQEVSKDVNPSNDEDNKSVASETEHVEKNGEQLNSECLKTEPDNKEVFESKPDENSKSESVKEEADDDDIERLIAEAEKEEKEKQGKSSRGGEVRVSKPDKMRFEDEPVYLYTSFAGGMQVASRTRRLETILTANQIKFSYRDLGTDPDAKHVWRTYSENKTLPGVVRGKDDFIGNWQDIEDANEDYAVRSLIYESF